MRRSGDKSLQRRSADSAKSHNQLASLRTTASSSSRAPTLSTSLLFARQRSSDSSALSSLPGEGHSTMAETTAPDTTIYPDTINPEFQPTRSTGGVSPGKSPLSSPVVEREHLNVGSPLFADLSSDYAMRGEESTVMPPNQTLDQMLAQDSKGTQQLLPLQQRQDAVLKVNDLADRVAATKPPPTPPVAAAQPVHVRIFRSKPGFCFILNQVLLSLSCMLQVSFLTNLCSHSVTTARPISRSTTLSTASSPVHL